MAESPLTYNEGDGMTRDDLLHHCMENLVETKRGLALHSILRESHCVWNGLDCCAFGTMFDELDVLFQALVQDPETVRTQDVNCELPIHVACQKVSITLQYVRNHVFW